MYGINDKRFAGHPMFGSHYSIIKSGQIAVDDIVYTKNWHTILYIYKDCMIVLYIHFGGEREPILSSDSDAEFYSGISK